MLKEYKLYAKTWKECARQCRANDLPETAVILLNPVDKSLTCKFKAIYDTEGHSLDITHLVEAGISLKLLSGIEDKIEFVNGYGHAITH